MTSIFRRWLPWLLIPFLSGSALATGFFHYADPLQDMRLAYDQNSRDSKAAYFQATSAELQKSREIPSGAPRRKRAKMTLPAKYRSTSAPTPTGRERPVPRSSGRPWLRVFPVPSTTVEVLATVAQD